MIKRFCDICGEEITEKTRVIGGSAGARLSTEIQKNGARLEVEILTKVDDVANAGDVCKYCVLDALRKLDDRPQACSRE